MAVTDLRSLSKLIREKNCFASFFGSETVRIEAKGLPSREITVRAVNERRDDADEETTLREYDHVDFIINRNETDEVTGGEDIVNRLAKITRADGTIWTAWGPIPEVHPDWMRVSFRKPKTITQGAKS